MNKNINNQQTYNGPVVGVILAGGRSRRMGDGDKSMASLSGEPLIAHAINGAKPQVAKLIINAPDGYSFDQFGFPVVCDTVGEFQGPLAGVLASLQWASKNMPDAKWVATFATDAPFVPTDMVTRMLAAINEGGMQTAIARSGGRNHPVFALWQVAAKDELLRAMKDDGLRRVGEWFEGRKTAIVDFTISGVDPFLNINTPEDMALAKGLIER